MYASRFRGYLSGIASLNVTGDVTMGTGSKLLLDLGTQAAPSLAFVGRTNTGMWSQAAGAWALGAGGEQVMAATAGLVQANKDLYTQRSIFETAISLTGDIVWALTGSVNDGAPTGLSTSSRIRITATIALSITGLTGGSDGVEFRVYNTSVNIVTLTAEDTLSAAANRFATAKAIPAGGMAIISYDATASRYRVI